MENSNIKELIINANYSRLKYISLVSLGFSLFYIITDFLIIGVWDDESLVLYKILDVVLIVISVSAVSFFWLLKCKNPYLKKTVIIIFPLVFMIWSAIITGVSYTEVGFSTLITAVLVISFFLYLNLTVSLLYFISSGLALIATLFFLKGYVNYNSIIMVLIPIICIGAFISVRNYNYKLNDFYNNRKMTDLNYKLNNYNQNLEYEVKKRSEELLLTIDKIKENEQKLKIKNQKIEEINKKLKLTNEELVLSKTRAEESDRLKSAFLANMSHEIRTPMNGILGFAGLLKEPELSGEMQQNYIEIIEKSGTRMLNIINDIVSISKIESGIIEIYNKEINVNEQLRFIYDSFKLDADNKKLTLTITNTLPEKEAIIITDSEKFYCILNNLVKNAIKYTNYGSIEFGYHLKTVNQTEELEFFIKDTGIGIPNDRQEAIFERFVQADIEDKMARQGAGLGLAIAIAYVEMLGGKIWVESEADNGSIFYFTLPYNSKSKEIPIDKSTGSNQNDKTISKILKILIVEDDEISAELVEIIVDNLSKEVLFAKNGLEAVNICRQNPDIDLILMDIQMSMLNGYMATQQIRHFNKDVIIIAQTAFSLTGDKEKAIDAGCNDYISKPVKKGVLLDMIQKYFGE